MVKALRAESVTQVGFCLSYRPVRGSKNFISVLGFLEQKNLGSVSVILKKEEQCKCMNSFMYDACDVTLSVYPHRASLKNMPDHGGNQTYDLWNTSPMLCQLSYAVWSVRVCDISEQNLVPSISML